MKRQTKRKASAKRRSDILKKKGVDGATKAPITASAATGLGGQDIAPAPAS